MTRKPPPDNRLRECKAHCASCHHHFSGIEAFDAHRIGSFDDPDDPRRCSAPFEDGDTRFEPATENGRCVVYADREGWGASVGITVWRLSHSGSRSRPLVASEMDLQAAEGLSGGSSEREAA
jgi:hypothetical protein